METHFGPSGTVPDEAGSHTTTATPVNESRPTSGKTYNEFGENTTETAVGEHHGRSVPMEEVTATELRRIATALSRTRTNATAAGGVFIDTALDPALNPALDPASDNFDVTKWVQHFVRHHSDKGHVPHGLGFLFRNLSVFGSGAALQLQDTVSSVLSAPLRPGDLFRSKKAPRRQILHQFNGLLKPGELLAVLGRPGSGCSTFLKTMCGELYGLELDDSSVIHYDGIPQDRMKKEFKGEVVYNQEVDKHFPHLTVGQTLEFAASMRTPSNRIHDMSRSEYCRYHAQAVMAMFGLSHTYHTKVGNDFIRGVSGGERKRVSIAEMMLAQSPICAWDNSTRGLDSSSALRFVQALRVSSDIGIRTHAVAMYQASQAIYDVFDKTTVLYEGRQVYFGPSSCARQYFERQGWECPLRQTTGDFLTSVTNPQERIAKPGMQDKVPRTAEEFERYWLASPEFAALQSEIEAYTARLSSQSFSESSSSESIPVGIQAPALHTLRGSKNHRQARHVRPKSPYTISIPMQIKLNTKRAYQRLWNNLPATLAMVVANLILALIIGSIFYGNPADATASFASKGSVLFMAILLNALVAISEIEALYAQREIVEKHHSYAFYHPATEAAAGIVADIPIKFATAVVFNILAYFLSGLRREPAQFFVYFLISYISTFVMSAVFRTLAAVTRTVSQAMALAGVVAIALIMYAGFIVAVPEMHPWFSWIRWINPIYYAFEIVIANEFHGREFVCSDRVPPYPGLPGGEQLGTWVCAAAGAVAGRETVSGDAYIATTYSYFYSHVWRNFGILLAFLVFFMGLYFWAVEMNSDVASTAEMLVFRRGRVPKSLSNDVEAVGAANGDVQVKAEQDAPGKNVSSAIEPQKDVFSWKDVVYDVSVKGDEGTRRLLDHVSGWVKPGTLTALMGASGAGKTTLLDVLAQRTSVGVVTGDMLVNGRPSGADFQRQTGYVQQQDLHLDTATVRESLRFSAMLRRPASVGTAEKYAFVEEVIKMLGMEEYADAVVGIPGQGLNVEQRKLLTIGVELVAKPKLLLFLDEPTSGLDSQSAWAICAFLRKLADAGQAVLCTIHQPNAILFQQFDRLLFLAKGGKTVYFGDVGRNSGTLLSYFENNGARQCGDQENPAEYMLEIVAEGTNSSGQDWHSVWKSSKECQGVAEELDRIHAAAGDKQENQNDTKDRNSEFAMPFHSQVCTVTERIFQQYWRMPGYVLAKVLLGAMSGIFIGFTFWKPDGTQAGMRGVVYAVFMITTIFTTLVQQIQPLFITQRSLYEVRERPSKAYSWKAFLIANITVEIPYQVLTGILTFACFYYPVMGTHQASSRQGLILLFTMQLFIYASAFAHMSIAALPDAQAAAGIVILLTMMSTIFSGVLQTKVALPGFWVFMYYVSPFTYWISGIVSTMLHDRPVQCSAAETLVFSPPPGRQNMTCAQYLGPMFQGGAPGVLQNPEALSDCRYCTMSVADEFMAGADMAWVDRWRNFGIMWGYIFFDIFAAVLFYYLFRVKKWSFGKTKTE